jgi:hypothetical protein
MFKGVYRVISARKTYNICRDFPAICKYYRFSPADIGKKKNICSVVSLKISEKSCHSMNLLSYAVIFSLVEISHVIQQLTEVY